MAWFLFSNFRIPISNFELHFFTAMDEISQPAPESPVPNDAPGTATKRATRGGEPAPAVKLEQYEGPLDLLLDLIRKQQINVYDIPISKITQQYLDYMQRALELDIELSSEFVYMAATLIHIKSKMLLPRDPELEKIAPEEDPRKELVERLIEHERFKNAAEMLQQKRMVEEAIWSNPQMEQFLSEEEGPGLAVTIFELVKTFQGVLDRAKNRPLYEIGKESVSVPDMIQFLRLQLVRSRRQEPLSATQL